MVISELKKFVDKELHQKEDDYQTFLKYLDYFNRKHDITDVRSIKQFVDFLTKVKTIIDLIDENPGKYMVPQLKEIIHFKDNSILVRETVGLLSFIPKGVHLTVSNIFGKNYEYQLLSRIIEIIEKFQKNLPIINKEGIIDSTICHFNKLKLKATPTFFVANALFNLNKSYEIENKLDLGDIKSHLNILYDILHAFFYRGNELQTVPIINVLKIINRNKHLTSDCDSYFIYPNTNYIKNGMAITAKSIWEIRKDLECISELLNQIEKLEDNAKHSNAHDKLTVQELISLDRRLLYKDEEINTELQKLFYDSALGASDFSYKSIYEIDSNWKKYYRILLEITVNIQDFLKQFNPENKYLSYRIEDLKKHEYFVEIFKGTFFSFYQKDKFELKNMDLLKEFYLFIENQITSIEKFLNNFDYSKQLEDAGIEKKPIEGENKLGENSSQEQVSITESESRAQQSGILEIDDNAQEKQQHIPSFEPLAQQRADLLKKFEEIILEARVHVSHPKVDIFIDNIRIKLKNI